MSAPLLSGVLVKHAISARDCKGCARAHVHGRMRFSVCVHAHDCVTNTISHQPKPTTTTAVQGYKAAHDRTA